MRLCRVTTDGLDSEGERGEGRDIRKGWFDLRMAGLWKGYFSDGLVCTLSALLCSTLLYVYSTLRTVDSGI